MLCIELILNAERYCRVCKTEILMTIIKHNPKSIFPPYTNYSHAVEINEKGRILFISGINGFLLDGKTMPEAFMAQAEIIWGHIGSVLRSADMSYENLVSLRVYLASREYSKQNAQLLPKYLGKHEPAITIICCQLLDSKWKLEIEAVAAT